MKYLIKYIGVVTLMLFLSGCQDFLNTNPDDIIDADDYIKEESEMYTGFLGIISKMQAAGDHAIILSDLRADYLEPTVEAPNELWQIYNYGNTNNNAYANPSCYYALIVACNDYLDKMTAYKSEVGDNMEENTEKYYRQLISSTIRVKVWAYLNLAKIYGKAVWFDDPLNEIKDLSDTKIFQRLNSPKEIVDKCLLLMENGITGIDGSLVMEWGEWLDPENPNNTDYTYWTYVVPDYICLYSELRLWRGETADYAWVKDNILQYLYDKYTKEGNSNVWRLCASVYNQYYRIFAQGSYYTDATVSNIIYDYDNGQTNRLCAFFAPASTSGGKYYLRPSAYGISTSHYKNGPTSDNRIKDGFLLRVINNDTCCYKYLYSRTVYEGDVSVPIYRSHDLHFMLAEAEAHLGNFKVAAAILNTGLNIYSNTAAMDADGLDPRYHNWIAFTGASSGICGVAGSTTYDLPTATSGEISQEELIRQYDMALLNEYCLEFYCEGKSYGAMIRMAQRYNDNRIIADIVCPKYPATLESSVRSAILSGNYYVDWDLQLGDVNTTINE